VNKVNYQHRSEKSTCLQVAGGLSIFISMELHKHILLAAALLSIAPAMAPATEDGCSGKGRYASRTMTTASAGDQRIDVTYYRLNLRVDHQGSLIRGGVQIAAVVLTDSLASVALDLSPSMIIDSVLQQGSPLPVTRFPSSFAVHLARTHTRGERVAIEVFYHGTPSATGFGSFVFASLAEGPWIWSLSQPYGARDWWPCKDHPSDKADSVDVLVTCADTLKVGSNGRLLSVRDNGDGTSTHTWAERYPIATYLVSVAIGPFASFSNWYTYAPGDSMEVLNYVLPQHLALARESLPKTIDMLGIFSRLYGPYPFLSEKYGHSEFGSGGAMEHQTMTSTTTFSEDVLAHELAHQWFGDLITCQTWQDLWLNEGFATYSESLYREARYGSAQYHAMIRYRLGDALAAQGSLFVLDTSEVSVLFARSRVYSKGASVLHMLRHVIGDSLFFQALRAYAADPRFRYGSARTADFQQVCESVYGQSLAWFFTQWVYGEKYPRYSLRWTASQDGSLYSVDAHLDQETGTTTPSMFVMPVDLRFSAASRETTVTVWNSRNSESFAITLPFRPEQVEVDPEQWILREVVEPNPALASTPILEPNYPNPFNLGTTMRVSNPRRDHLTLTIHNILGQLIATVFDGIAEPGVHEYQWSPGAEVWIPEATRDRKVATGVYFCRLVTNESVLTRNMVYIR
jgi:aminopeptidase N